MYLTLMLKETISSCFTSYDFCNPRVSMIGLIGPTFEVVAAAYVHRAGFNADTCWTRQAYS